MEWITDDTCQRSVSGFWIQHPFERGMPSFHGVERQSGAGASSVLPPVQGTQQMSRYAIRVQPEVVHPFSMRGAREHIVSVL